MSDADKGSSNKKNRDRIQQLSEIRRGLVHHTDAQYGTADDPMFVMHLTVDGVVFQGVGPSKKRAKMMASERALAHLGVISASEVQMPQPEITAGADDHTADVFTGLLYSNFISPNTSADDASLKLPQYRPEGLFPEEEYDSYSLQEAFENYIGFNAVSIMSEIRPDAIFEIVYASVITNPTRFVTSVRVKGRSYCGDATSKKISKGRAAAMALTDIYGIEFGTAEDGMPVYEGSTKVWENYKAQLEKEAEIESVHVNVVNPIEQLNELFPEAQFEFPGADEKSGGFFRAQFTVSGNTYEGLGMNKRDAKANAAANTIEGLEKSGLLQQRKSEIEAKRKEKQKLLEGENVDKPKSDKSDPNLPLSRNPCVKLQSLFPHVEFNILGEAPLRNTAMRAFISGVRVEEQSFVGVGKSKKLAKAAAAEKALRILGRWTDEDEEAKNSRLKDKPPLAGVEGLADARLHSMMGPYGMNQYGRSARGRGGWNFGSRPYGQMGRGRMAGYNGQEWYGGAMGEEPEGLDMMINDLSLLVGQILESNPNMGVSGVWNVLQQNSEFRSWCSGTLDMQSLYCDPYGAEYYGSYGGPSGGYSGEGYYMPEAYTAAGRGRGRGMRIRSWSRDAVARKGRGGMNQYQNWF